MTRIVAVIVGALSIPGCGVGTNCAPPAASCNSTEGGNGLYEGRIALDRIHFDCCRRMDSARGTCTGNGEWWADVILDGRATNVTVTLTGEGDPGWTETHTLPVVSRDPEGYWEERYRNWSVADLSECDVPEDCADLYVDGIRTLFSCTPDFATTLRTTVNVYTTSPDTPSACATWGPESIPAPSTCIDAERAGLL